jgi:hypothetical protein
MDNDDSKKSFLKHVFNFDDDSKSEILNIIQYALIAIIPVVIFNKTIGKYVPEADDKKGSLELSAEIVLQIIVTFVGLLIIHRIITFVPTYSKMKYPEFSIVFIILAVLMITLSLQTKLGEKVSILVDRIFELWDGKSDGRKKGSNNKQPNVRVSQPISGQNVSMTGQQMSQPSNPTYSDGTSINSLPTNDNSSNNDDSVSSQQLPNYNNMYRGDTTKLVNAASPGQQDGFMEPMAANSVLGGGAFGSW